MSRACLGSYRDVNVPFAVLAVGLLITGASMADVADKHGWLSSIIAVGVKTAIELLVVLLGLTIAGRMANIDFGPKKNAVFKLAALYLGPNSLWLILPVLMGDDGVEKVVAAFSCLILYWSLLWYMFRLTAWKVGVCIGSIVGVKVAAEMFLLWVLAGMLLAAFGR